MEKAYHNLIETPLLYLRVFTPEVQRYIFENYDEAGLQQFLGTQTPEQLERERQIYLQGLTGFGLSFKLFRLIEKSTGEMAGWCGYHKWYTHHCRAELGYWLLHDKYKRRGYMKEALPKVLEYGFNEMQLERIEAFVSADNEPSLKLLQSNGFEYEGLLKKHYRVNGVNEESLLYGLVK